MLRALGSSMLLLVTAAAQTNFPSPPAPANNQPTQDKALLGMALFFEEQLSSTGTVACATCHSLQNGGIDTRTATSPNPGADGAIGTADDQFGSPGIPWTWAGGQLVPHPVRGFSAQVTQRRAPTVINSGYHTHLAYDGSRSTLEELIAVPPLNPVEMGHSGRTWAEVTQKIQNAQPLVFASDLPQRLQNFLANRSYPDLFQIAFGSTQVTQQRIVNAIATYIRTLNSDQSKWDLHLHGQAQLTAQEQLGLTLFTTPAGIATSCNTCHGDFEQRVLTEGPIAGQMTMVVSGPYGAPIPTRLVFHNVGVRPPAEDPGRMGITNTPGDAGKFRVASLRNVELTGPYFHNGSIETLTDVLEFYDRGGDFHSNQAANLVARNYTTTEKDAIVALLETLTDPRLAAGLPPFDQPTLGSQNGAFAEPIGNGATTQSGQLTALAPYAPRVGEPWFQLTLTGVTPGTFTFLMWDVAQGPAGQPYGVELGLTPSFAMFGIGLSQWAWTMPQSGYNVVALPIPNAPGLSGQTLFTQWLALEPAQQWPMATSNALRITLQ